MGLSLLSNFLNDVKQNYFLLYRSSVCPTFSGAKLLILNFTVIIDFIKAPLCDCEKLCFNDQCIRSVHKWWRKAVFSKL